MHSILCALAALIMLGGVAQAKVPEWAKKNAHSVNGRILKTVCSGTGPSIDIARKEALESCRLTARQQLTTNIKVRSLTIQTEKSSGFHEEISENTQYTGLNCNPEKDEVIEREGSYQVWMKCRFNLSQVKVVPATTEEIRSNPKPQNDETVSNGSTLKELRTRPQSVGTEKIVRDDRRNLSIASIPRCESLMIRGQKPRVIDCKNNPVTVVLDGGDDEIIVRAEGYEPKRILLNKEGKTHESIQVTLDLL